MEARYKHLHKVIHLFAATGFQRFFQARFRQQEFVIPCGQLFETLQIGTQRVGLFDQRLFIFRVLMLVDKRLEDITQLFGHHLNQLLLGNFLNGLIFLRNLRVEIFHRRRQVAGEHF